MAMMDGPSWEELGIVKRGLWCDFCFLPSAVKIRIKDESTGLTMGYTYVCVECERDLASIDD